MGCIRLCRCAAPSARRLALIAAMVGGLALSGCGALQPAERPVTWAWPAPAGSPLALAFAARFAGHDGMSGLHALPGGLEALGTRAALAQAAVQTLDLQYYIVRADATTQLLMARVLAAAQRGVRVRLLVDDLDAAGKDLDLATFAGFPNVEVRLFNPFSSRGAFGLAQVLEFVGDPQRLNRRMHNKLWIADNAMAVVGGRNLGDEYFDASGAVNFSDLDLLVAGPAVAEISRSFDAYWNSEWAVPVRTFVQRPPTADALARFEQDLLARVAGLRETDYGRALREGRSGLALLTGRLPLAMAPVQVFADPPGKKAPGAEAAPPVFAAHIRPLVAGSTRELILISPYFIPSDEGLDLLAGLARRGVRVRVLTNSLASAEKIPLAQSGYARRRDRLLAAGVELHEMRPEATPRAGGSPAGSSGTSLHTKAIVIDRRHVVVGSMNLDPRSRHTNTEVGVVAHSTELGDAMGRLFDEATQPARAFRVVLAPVEGSRPQVRWLTEHNGTAVVYETEPLVGFWRRALSWLLGVVAPEHLL